MVKLRLVFVLVLLGGLAVYGGVAKHDWRLGETGAAMILLAVLPSVIGYALYRQQRSIDTRGRE